MTKAQDFRRGWSAPEKRTPDVQGVLLMELAGLEPATLLGAIQRGRIRWKRQKAGDYQPLCIDG